MAILDDWKGLVKLMSIREYPGDQKNNRDLIIMKRACRRWFCVWHGVAVELLVAIVLCGVSNFSVQGADCSASPSGLAGWWPAEGNVNDVVSTNHGAFQGGASGGATGAVGSAFSFDGTNGFVQIPDASVFHPTNLTIECWVRFSSLDSAGSGGSPAGDQYVVFKQNSRNSGFEGFDLSKTRSGNDVFRFLVSSSAGQSVEVHSTSAITVGTWYHVAAVRGSNFISLYVNGQLQNQATVGFAQDYGTIPLFFGTSGQSYWDHKLKGNLDEVSLYNRALNSAEILAIYNAGAAGKCRVGHHGATREPDGTNRLKCYF